jgi:ABC-2 type transport system permease protein
MKAYLAILSSRFLALLQYRYEMTRPVDLYAFWFARALSGRAAPLVMRAIPIFIIAGLFLGLQPPVSLKAGLMFIVSAFGGLLMASSLVALTTIA